jgi:hypothetical protein
VVVSQAVVDGSITSVQVDVPLQLRSTQSVSVQEIETPVHTPPPQVSLWEHKLPSSHDALSRHCHEPPVLVQ